MGSGFRVLPWRAFTGSFESLTFAVDVGEARGEMGDLGLRELSREERADKASSSMSAVRVWSMGSHPRDSSLMGVLEVTPEGLSMSEVAPAGPQLSESTVPAHRASTPIGKVSNSPRDIRPGYHPLKAE